MRSLHLACATILTRVTGFGENIIPLLRLEAGDNLFGVWPYPVKYFRENRDMRGGFLNGYFH
jgi:hypothetical protein